MPAKIHKAEISRSQHVLDAAELPVGRLSSMAVRLLVGKHKTSFQPNLDVGDFVRIVNASRVRFTGKKFAQKGYYDMSRYPGGIRRRQVSELAKTKPAEIYRRAIFAMLPKNRHRSARMQRLTVSNGT